MEKKQFVQKARTIASFVKKNNHLFKQSSNELAQFLYQELSKHKKYTDYIYHLDNVVIRFFLDHYNGDGRDGGYLCCNIWAPDNKTVFYSDAISVKYYYNSKDNRNVDIDNFSLYDKIFNNFLGREEKRNVLFEWDKIIECMERCF